MTNQPEHYDPAIEIAALTHAIRMFVTRGIGGPYAAIFEDALFRARTMLYADAAQGIVTREGGDANGGSGSEQRERVEPDGEADAPVPSRETPTTEGEGG